MLASLHNGSAGQLLRSTVASIESIVQRLEVAATAGGDNWPLCSRLGGLDCLCCDLKSSVAGDGVTGAEIYLVAAQARDTLSPIVEAHDHGDLKPWRSCRDGLMGILYTLRQLVEPQLEAEIVAVLQALMRHESIETTLRYYVGANAERTAETYWAAIPGVRSSCVDAFGGAHNGFHNTPPAEAAVSLEK